LEYLDVALKETADILEELTQGRRLRQNIPQYIRHLFQKHMVLQFNYLTFKQYECDNFRP